MHMAYIRETCEAGKTISVRLYYSATYNKETKSRQPKKRLTTEAQREVNRQQAVRKLTRLMNANFGADDYYITLDYRKEERPASPDEMRNEAREFLKQLRRAYKKAGKILKYIYVAERGKRGALHHHLVISGGVDVKVLKDIWQRGWITIKPLDKSGHYPRLAEYFIKWSHEAMQTDAKIHGKHWNSSRNLIHPVPEKEIVSERRWYREEARPIPGYYVDPKSIQSGIHEKTGYPFFYYVLVKSKPDGGGG